MAANWNISAASRALPPSDTSRQSEQLSEELVLQKAVLASLRDIHNDDAPIEEIAAIQAKIAEIKTKLKDLRTPSGVSRTNDSSRFGGPGTSATTRHNTNSIGSSPWEGLDSSSGIPSRKRSIGSSHLTAEPSSLKDSKSRRTTPSLAPWSFGSGAGGFGDDDVENMAIIDLTGPSQAPSWTMGRTNPIKEEPSSSLPARPHASVKSEPGSFASRSISAVKSKPRENQYRVPGAWDDSDDEDEEFSSTGRLPSLGAPSRPSRPSLPSFNSASSFPSPSSSVRLPTLDFSQPPNGFGTSNSLQYKPNVPAIELARQSSMARQQGSSAWPPVGPIAQYVNSANSLSPAATHPGYMSNGRYFHPLVLSTLDTGLAATINRVNGYDFNNMTDAYGKALDSRLANFIDDYVNDPRKTEEDIQQLLSNIRPDMEIPVEERGETPDAMKYTLYPHQQVALKWMSDMEEGTNKGGILADDMGLGKTISTLSLMVSRPSTDNVKTNLIVGPVALIKQWEQEIKNKLKGTHRLSVYLLHMKRMSYSDIKRYDVVLTTYGSIASEWKRYTQHVEQRKESAGYDEGVDQELAKKCPLLHPRSKFYRVILDEAQCIKNKDTQGSKAAHQIHATYRWCLTGTPMMNGVSELYPLIRFLRIRPYCDFKVFQNAFKSLTAKNSGTSDYSRDNAMRQLQAVLKAMMLRRMKNSMIDGKPILSLKPKTETSEHAVFSDDERKFYTDLESRSQVLFNKYLRTGTVGKNYSNILVLLLRLRQACCHPHLMDFECVAATSDTQMTDLAKELKADVVQRIKAIEAFECPICYDGVEDPILVVPCGHDTCPECFTSLTETAAQNGIQEGNERGSAKCPVCRGGVDSKRVITYTAFRKVHMPKTIETEEGTPEEPAEVTDSEDSSSGDDDEADFDTDSDIESDAGSNGNLLDFVVPDDEVDDESDLNEDDIDVKLGAFAKAKKENEPLKDGREKKAKKAKKAKKRKAKKAKMVSKSDNKAKGKAKVEAVKPHMLKKLRTDAAKNKEARRRYMHYLRDNWEDSAKISQVVDLLMQIQETDEKTIIFSQWTALLDLIEVQVKYRLSLRYCRYTGDMSRNARDDAVRDFTENLRTKVMLVSLRAGNAGLNLVAASRIIICDPFWNPYIEMQAVDRAHRIGQQREVQVHRILVKETVEDRILDLQEKKRALVEAALDEGQSKSVGRLSERELAYLFGVNPARR
ncbi:hypothetical protein N0V88_003754 [Collariella sp. IMI 366227]|nr:hypothetical protein N0V88_003754 [Collariella sp. IMI 366227]